MKRGIGAVLGVILLISCVACQRDGLDERIHKRYRELESYTALISVTVTGNKGTETYEISQSWKAPDRYRAEVVSPAHMRGTVTVADGNQLWLRAGNAPALRLEPGMAAPQTDALFLPGFLAAYYRQENLPALCPDGEGLLLLEGPRQGSRYRFAQNLWLDGRSGLPVRLVTYDEDGNERLRVEYRDFAVNPRIEDSVFLP